ncbi:MAG: TolB-like protein/class 3 adenylate cyclase/Flp pilus assembly protein TadD [Planctomycetota bacterium]
MGQRQLAAIMFTDFVGYSALTQRNEALALTLLEKHWALLRPIFAKFDGREIKTIGDALLIEFPSTLQAVEAGLAMQVVIKEYNDTVDQENVIQIRIGIHTGDVERRGDDVFGDGVNIAARLEPLATPGGICISEPVYTSVNNKIDVPFYSMGEQNLKNISQSIVAYSHHPEQKAKIIKSNFLNELRRRNVFKVGVAYTIVAWIIIQVAAVTFPALHLPSWAITLVTVLILMGFPVALLLAWAFELTPDGVVPTRQIGLIEASKSTGGRKFEFTIITLLLTAVIFLIIDNYVWVEETSAPKAVITAATEIERTRDESNVANQKSVAVLPFANRSKSEDDAYFADGLHDDLLTHLSKITDMKVISRTSVMGYRGTTKNMKTIGGELGVATLLEGSVQRAANQVRINVQLIDVNTDEHLWAEIYDRELTAANIFAIQSEISTAIAKALRATLSPEEQERLGAVPTENLSAYEAYLLGKQRMVSRISDRLAEAVDYFEQAIALDPLFALAYVGLSDTTQLQFLYSGLPREEMNAKAEMAINKALALDDKLGEAYASLGLLKLERNDYIGAEAAFKQALTLNPNYATSYHWYGSLFSELGQLEEATAQMQKALTLDPLSIVINTNVAFYLAQAGEFDKAMAQFEKIIEIDPTAAQGYVGKARLYWSVYGRLDEAVLWIRKAVARDPNSPQYHAFSSGLFLTLGDDRRAECWGNRAMKLGPEDLFSNLIKVYLHTSRKENELALSYAMKALEIDHTNRDALILLRDNYLQAGSYENARSLYEKSYPALLTENEPVINRTNYQEAIDLAYVLQLSGEQERANILLGRSLAFIRSGVSLLDFGSYKVSDVRIFAMLGEKQEALTALRLAIDEGWRDGWWYFLEIDPSLESIRSEPEFQAMLAEIKGDMASQLTRVIEMEKAGDICAKPD